MFRIADIYIYIYECKERERERDLQVVVVVGREAEELEREMGGHGRKERAMRGMYIYYILSIQAKPSR